MNETIDAKYRIHLNDDDGGTGSISDDLIVTASEVARARAGKLRNPSAYVLAVCENDDTTKVEREFAFPSFADLREFAGEYGFKVVEEEWKYDVPYSGELDDEWYCTGAARSIDVLVDLHVSYAVDKSTTRWTF